MVLPYGMLLHKCLPDVLVEALYFIYKYYTHALLKHPSSMVCCRIISRFYPEVLILPVLAKKLYDS